MTGAVKTDVSMYEDDQSIRSRHAARSLLDCVDLCLEDNLCHSAFYYGDSSHKHSESTRPEESGPKSLHHWYICIGGSKIFLRSCRSRKRSEERLMSADCLSSHLAMISAICVAMVSLCLDFY